MNAKCPTARLRQNSMTRLQRTRMREWFSAKSGSEPKSRILVTASRTAGQLNSHALRVELITANTVKRSPASLAFEGPMIPTIVPKPERQEDDGDEQAVDDGSYGKIEHRNG